ncbi:MAG: hypothetical protein ABIW79_04490, partial [Gemmatimonas sp.]
DGDWYLGRRSHDGAGWDIVQPVIGPLMPAAARGVTFTVSDSNGTALSSGASNAAAVRVRFRARRVGVSSPAVDSAFTDVALRGRNDE